MFSVVLTLVYNVQTRLHAAVRTAGGDIVRDVTLVPPLPPAHPVVGPLILVIVLVFRQQTGQPVLATSNGQGKIIIEWF